MRHPLGPLRVVLKGDHLFQCEPKRGRHGLHRPQHRPSMSPDGDASTWCCSWRLDRAFRSVVEGASTLEPLHTYGCRFRSLQERTGARTSRRSASTTKYVAKRLGDCEDTITRTNAH